MYAEWPFFQSTFDLIEMVLAKADMRIASLYDQVLAAMQAIDQIGLGSSELSFALGPCGLELGFGGLHFGKVQATCTPAAGALKACCVFSRADSCASCRGLSHAFTAVSVWQQAQAQGPHC